MRYSALEVDSPSNAGKEDNTVSPFQRGNMTTTSQFVGGIVAGFVLLGGLVGVGVGRV